MAITWPAPTARRQLNTGTCTPPTNAIKLDHTCSTSAPTCRTSAFRTGCTPPTECRHPHTADWMQAPAHRRLNAISCTAPTWAARLHAADQRHQLDRTCSTSAPTCRTSSFRTGCTPPTGYRHPRTVDCIQSAESCPWRSQCFLSDAAGPTASAQAVPSCAWLSATHHPAATCSPQPARFSAPHHPRRPARQKIPHLNHSAEARPPTRQVTAQPTRAPSGERPTTWPQHAPTRGWGPGGDQ
jgi:hypothetical protein